MPQEGCLHRAVKMSLGDPPHWLSDLVQQYKKTQLSGKAGHAQKYVVITVETVAAANTMVQCDE